ncbi:hypothetical protein ACWEVY_28525 [Streptomyces longwoodensis]
MHEHAQKIAAAIQAAWDEGFELDNGEGDPIRALDLNEVTDGRLGNFTSIPLPEPTFF